MNTIGQRLDYAMDIKHKTKNAVATGIGAHPSTIDNYIKSKVNNPNPIILEKIANYLDISSEWLILGMGKIDDKNENESTLGDFENLSTDTKLDKIYALLLELKQGQNILGEGLISLTDND